MEFHNLIWLVYRPQPDFIIKAGIIALPGKSGLIVLAKNFGVENYRSRSGVEGPREGSRRVSFKADRTCFKAVFGVCRKLSDNNPMGEGI